MQQTYVNVDSPYVWHRIGQMYGNPAFVYVETTGWPIEDTISGALDAEWAAVIASIPSNAIFAPIAESNGYWTTYNGTVEQVRQAYARIDAIDGGRHRICGSFTIMSGSNAYLQAVRPYVDLACPSHYDTNGTVSAATIAAQARNHAASAGLPLILAQTGTTRTDKVGWTQDLGAALGSTVYMYFDQHQYAFSGGWPFS
jgi:hypothetical protein